MNARPRPARNGSHIDDSLAHEQHYWAFISYSWKDKKWGEWLHKRLESYPIPEEFRGTEVYDGAVLGKNLRPVFRDRDEMAVSGELGPAISDALGKSRFLIVLCSRNSATSKWVNKEIEEFIKLGGKGNILALIIDGQPNATSNGSIPDSEECFPAALRGEDEPLAGDLRKEGDGKERGFLKIIAGVSQLNFDALYRRHERAQKKKRATLASLAMAIIASLSGLTFYALQQRAEAQANAAAATEARVMAESNEERATGLLVSSYIEQGRQAFLDGAFADALAFLHQARMIDPKETGLELMMADAWRKVSSLRAEISGDPNAAISHLHFSKDGGILAAQDSHGTAKVYELYPARRTLASSGFMGFMHHPFIFSSSPYLVGFFKQTDPTAPDRLQREIRRYDWHEGGKRGSIPWRGEWSNPVLMVASPGGSLIATSFHVHGDQDSEVWLWKFEGEKVSESRFGMSESPNNFHWFFSGDEQTLVQMRYAGSTFDVSFRESTTGKLLRKFPLVSRPEVHATFEDRFCIGLNNGNIVEFHRDGDTITRRDPMEEGGARIGIGAVHYSADGKLLLANWMNGDVILYDSGDLSTSYRIDGGKTGGPATHAALSRTGRLIAVAQGRQISVFRQDGEMHSRYSWAGTDATAVTFSGDEAHLAAGTQNGNIRIWSLEKQAPWYRQFLPDKTAPMIEIRHIGGDQDLVKGACQSYLFDLSDESLTPLPDEQRPVAAISPDRKLMELGDGNTLLVIKNKETDKAITSSWHSGAQNEFLPPSSPAAGVMVRENGLVQAYSSSLEVLSKSHRSEDVRGQPVSLVIGKGHSRGCAGFSDGGILEFELAGDGIGNTNLHRLPGSEKARPVLHALNDARLLLSLDGQMAIYHLNSRTLVRLPRLNLRAGAFIKPGDASEVLTINAYGTLELWSVEGDILASASSPVSGNPDAIRLGNEDVAGSTILVGQDSGRAYTSFGNRLYIWSLPELSLVWRSPPLSVGGNVHTLRRVSEAGNRVIITESDRFQAGSGFRNIRIVDLPTVMPGLDEASRYLSEIAGIRIVDGRIIRK